MSGAPSFDPLLSEPPFAGPANSLILWEIVAEVLHEVGPDEAVVTAVFIDPLLEEFFHGQMVSFDTSEEAGSFGGADWLVVTLVPLVATTVELLQRRLAELGESGATRPDLLITDLVTPSKVAEMARRVNSSHAREQAAAIARALHTSLAARLGRLQRLERHE